MTEPKKLLFEVDTLDIKEEIENSQFIRARAKIFSSGPNLHGMPVLESALYNAESSIYDKPLIWEYSKTTQDAMDHTKNQVPCGFVPRLGANVAYERANDGRLFFIVDLLIWRFYSGKLLEIFEKTDGKKSVSVEIMVTGTTEDEDGVKCISDFTYFAITILGERYTPAIPDAAIQLQQYSVDKSEVEEILRYTFSNKFQEKEDDQEVSFDKEEFAKQFSITANQMREWLYVACKKEKYEVDGRECTRYWLEDYDNTYIFAYDSKDDTYAALPYTIENNEVEVKFELAKLAMRHYAWTILDDEQEVMSVGLKEFAKELLAAEFAVREQEIAALREQLEEINTQKETFVATIAEHEKIIETLQSENTSLAEFKANVEHEAKIKEMEYALNLVSEDLTPQQIEEWREKMTEFDSPTEYANNLKAFAYEKFRGKQKKDDNFLKAALPKNNDDPPKVASLWEKY